MVWHDFVPRTSVGNFGVGQGLGCGVVDTEPHFSYKKAFGFLQARIEFFRERRLAGFVFSVVSRR
jgi:hypothetical protein